MCAGSCLLNFGSIIQPKFGGKIIDIVSGDTETPEQKVEALAAVRSTILSIFLIVIVGYDTFYINSKFCLIFKEKIISFSCFLVGYDFTTFLILKICLKKRHSCQLCSTLVFMEDYRTMLIFQNY